MSTYGLNGNLESVMGLGAPVTMAYDYENRLVSHVDDDTETSYTYSGDGLKRTEQTKAGVTTLIWDGGDYLGEIS